MTFPDDENGEILAEMAEAGIDFEQTYQVDFFAAFEFEDRANAAIDTVKKLTIDGLKFSEVSVGKPEEGGGFELVASLSIKLEHAVITAIDEAFTECVESVRGYSDGWGVSFE
ncbi:ribonuclease E inhibitor RraB [Catenovulum sp. SM1970]|uniref:ribonuclease E inhibitor RraB n=1 Tax=Marinifaba aquimaris TaxID=2741323 RepID=UPI0015737262|nr:ribonuclease E inhibitor RraB [Marinifaba aquimaris]NTS76842.1 ribonuclease E inhibitor RraB [Marinifaba aquimaris]